jgi:hypothetical protein
MKQACFRLPGFPLLSSNSGESLFTGLEMLRHLIFRELSFAKFARSF